MRLVKLLMKLNAVTIVPLRRSDVHGTCKEERRTFEKVIDKSCKILNKSKRGSDLKRRSRRVGNTHENVHREAE